MNREEILEEIEGLAKDLGGEVHHSSTLNSVGRTSNKIVIEYDIKNTKKQCVVHKYHIQCYHCDSMISYCIGIDFLGYFSYNGLQ